MIFLYFIILLYISGSRRIFLCR